MPSDLAIGTFLLTLTNVIIGSAIEVQAQDGSASLHNRTATATTEVVTLGAYGSASPLGDLRIKVRKGSAAPYYQPYETLLTAFVGSASVYISQIPD